MEQGFQWEWRRIGLGALLSVAAIAVVGPVSAASANISAENDPNVVAQAIGGQSGGFSPGYSDGQAGVGDNAGHAGFPVAGGNFGVITSGDAEIADEPNDSPSSSGSYGVTVPARGGAFDPMTLGVSITVPGNVSCLLVDYKFFSEEFPEFVNAGFNDAFVAELDTTDWTLGSDPKTGQAQLIAPNDFAAGYGDQVSVDTVGPTAVSEADAQPGTTYDAGTPLLTAKVPITAGQHTVYFSVYDAGDSIYDSAAFIDNLRFNTEGPQTCQAPDLFGGAVGVTAGSNKINFDGKNGTFPLTCTLPEGASDPCIGKVVITATVPGGGGGGNNKVTLSKKKKIKVAKGTYSVEPATTGAATVKLSKKGKKLFKTTKKAKGKIKLTNTVNGASVSFKAKLKK